MKMSEKEIGQIPQIVRELVNHLPKAMDEDLKNLIALAEEGQDTTVEIINLFSQHKATRRWIKEQIALQSAQKGTPYGNAPLAGNPSRIPASQKWVCPEDPLEPWVFVIQEGETPPVCEQHNIEMIRGDEVKSGPFAIQPPKIRGKSWK
jgi:hypothetical protein